MKKLLIWFIRWVFGVKAKPEPETEVKKDHRELVSVRPEFVYVSPMQYTEIGECRECGARAMWPAMSRRRPCPACGSRKVVDEVARWVPVDGTKWRGYWELRSEKDKNPLTKEQSSA